MAFKRRGRKKFHGRGRKRRGGRMMKGNRVKSWRVSRGGIQLT